MQNGQDERRDVRVFTLEELERVTSEHTLKNTVNMHAERRRPHQLVENLSIHYLQFLGVLKYSLNVNQRAHVCLFLPHSLACAWVYVCLLLLHVSVTWLACVPVFLCTFVCVGLLCGGFLAVERPGDVRLRAGSQYPVLQEEISGVSQVCGAALPSRCECVLLAHGSAASAALEQLAHRCVGTVFIYYGLFLKSFTRHTLALT